ncbi:histidine kinase [Pseudonocardia tropica]|uniref:histidine kinase n=1 Tax=Pseudonocardia tropica TaxID=681289 RepID=A0ABV1JZ82_9PSEU
MSTRPPRSPRSPDRVRPYLVDGAVAGAVFLYSLPLLPAAVPERLSPLVAAVLTAAVCGSYLLSRERPVVAHGTGALAVGAQLVLGIGFVPATVVPLLTLYRVAVRCGRRASAVLAVLTAVAVVAAAARWDDPYFGVPEVVSAVLLVASVWVWGTTIGVRRAYVVAVEERAAQLEREQENLRRIVLATERTRIARELHDVVSHGLGVVVVLAAGAAAQARTDPAAAERAMRAVELTGRRSLSEMRRMLDVLRDDEPGPTGPQPGLAQLDRLLDEVRAAGLPVELVVSGERTGLAAGVDLTAYRIVQEALTNVRRHAGPEVTGAAVELRFGQEGLVVRVADDGGGPAGPDPAAGTGRGLVGMRERVAGCGGTLHTGPGRTGGFEVLAHLPPGGAV